MRTNFEIKNRNISYTRQGTGFPVVFLHGFCEDLTMWDAFQPFDLADYCIVKVDLAGFGQSEVDPQLSMETMASDVKSVLDREGIDSCILIGHSMGGYVGLTFAELFPDYLRGFGLFHSHPYEDSDKTKPLRKKAVSFIEKHGSELFVGQLLPKLFEESFLEQNASFIEDLVAYASNFSAEGIRTATIAMLHRKNQTTVLENMECPVLFIIGDQDYAIDMEISRRMSYMPAVASIHILRNCGHMALYERKEESEEIVGEFVRFCID